VFSDRNTVADTALMQVALFITLLLAVPLLVGCVAGWLVPKGGGYRQTPAVAGFCMLGLDVVILIVGSATTPQSACGGTGCDTGYGVGVMALSVPIFALAFAGAALGRLVAQRRS
jgi:hypothetical protein